ncbi:hypothetical protein RB195_015597 [Necator americanus]|uniref:Transposase n=1 Tax=Necator americanus TaxID=51031 RepID=A0ABR1E5J6_NECAM
MTALTSLKKRYTKGYFLHTKFVSGFYLILIGRIEYMIIKACLHTLSKAAHMIEIVSDWADFLGTLPQSGEPIAGFSLVQSSNYCELKKNLFLSRRRFRNAVYRL